MKITKSAAFLAGFYASLLILWFCIFLLGIKDAPINFIFAFLYGLIPIIGAFFGIEAAQHWGMFKSAMGKAIMFISAGLFTWGMGEMIWTYYIFFLKVEIPYPSLADASFVVSWPLWIVGTLFLSLATGAKYGLRHKNGKLQFLIIPLVAAIISYYLLIVVARGGYLTYETDFIKVFFDLAYPFLDVVILTQAALVYGLSFRYLGGKYKWPVIIFLSGIVVNYFADFGFSYTTTVETFYNGSWVDLLFMTAMFLLSYGVNLLDIRKDA